MMRKSKNILILSASVGAGHLRAAEAIELALRLLYPKLNVKNIDVLTLANKAFRRLYGQAYFDFVNHAPYLVGYIYDLLDQPPAKKARADRFRIALEKLSMHPFITLLESEPWDVVINTHFLPAEIIASLRRSGKLSIPHMTVTTDFETHRLWVHSPCEHYFTATAEGAAYLRYWDVRSTDITVTGIPIHPIFSQKKERDYCLASQGLKGKNPLILLLSGGFGVGPIEKLYRSLLDIAMQLEIVVVTGKNEELMERLNHIEPPSRHFVKILGFTTQIDELMAVADIIITKPGGLTSSEILAKGAAMAIVNPIPGQESRNSDFLLENGAAIKINTISTMPYKLTELLNAQAKLAMLKSNAFNLSRPKAAFDIAHAAVDMVDKNF